MEDETESATSNGSGLGRARAALSGTCARRRLKDVPEVRRRELTNRSLDLALSGRDPMFASIITFLKSPNVANIRDIGGYDVAVVEHGNLGSRLTREGPAQARRDRDCAAGIAE